MKKIISLFVCLIAMITVHGQAIKTYSGTYIIDGESQYEENVGTATYTYYNDESGNRVYHGAFVFKSSNSSYPHQSISGHYVHGKRSGKWKIGRKGTSGTGFTNVYYVYEGVFKNDTLNGLYREYIMYYDHSNSVFHLNENGQMITGMPSTPERQFTVYGDKIVGPVISHSYNTKEVIRRQKEVTGQTNERGKATGTWVVRDLNPDYAHIIQKRIYYEGVCYKILTEDNSTGKITVEYQLPENFVSALKSTYNALSNTFIYFSDIYQLIDYGYTRRPRHAANLIDNVIDSFENYPIDPATLELLTRRRAQNEDYTTSFQLFNLGRMDLDIYSYAGVPYGNRVKILSPYSLFTKRSTKQKEE